MSKTLRTLLIIVCAALLIIMLAVLNKKPHVSGETIRIGAALGLTGDAASWAEMAHNGAQLAVEEINAAGGIRGKQVELVVEDTKSSSKDSISAVQKLTAVDGISAILGPSWLDVYPGAQGIVADKNIVLISPDAGVEAVNSPTLHSNVFSSWYRSQPKAETLVAYLAKSGVKRLAVVYQNDAYYTDLSDRIEREAAKHGITIVRREAVNSGEGDFRTLLSKLKTDQPDIIFFALYDQKGMDGFFRNRAAIYPESKIASDEFGQDYVTNDSYKPYIDGMVFFAATRQDQSFDEKFEARFGMRPVFGASNAYDSIYMLAEAVDKSPEDIAGYMRTHTFETATFGKMKFDAINGVETENQQFVMKQVTNGEVINLQ